MSQVIQRTVTSGELPDSFFQLKQRLFEANNLVVEESPELVQKLLSFQYEKATIELFMIEDRARLIGIHPNGDSVAYFGFWEVENDSSLNEKLFTTFEGWASQQGCTRIEGPKNFNTFHSNRLRTSSASWQQFNHEPVYPSYYSSLLKRLGYHEEIKYSSKLLSADVIPDTYINKKELIDGLSNISYDFISLDEKVWEKYKLEIFLLVGEIFGLNPGYKSVSFAEFELKYNSDFAKMICPYTSVLLADRSSGKLVGISLCYPNYIPLSLSEKPVFTKHYPLLQHRTLLAKTQGVHPDYRKQGLMNFLGAYGMLSFRKYYDDIIFCLMREGNPSLRFTEPFQYEEATYALFAK